ncbi:MAG: hypothetical protein M1823_005526 [Watsoniomyces obsoletus]|nr:MAG: hypothetical protein M1823_005526 [Watsoniomyces obsoletus]
MSRRKRALAEEHENEITAPIKSKKKLKEATSQPPPPTSKNGGDGVEEIITLRPNRPKPTMLPPKSNLLLTRLQSFIPELAQANQELDTDRLEGRLESKQLDRVDEGESHIEMNLGLGVLEDKRDDSLSSSSEEDDDDEGTGPDIGPIKPAAKKPKIEKSSTTMNEKTPAVALQQSGETAEEAIPEKNSGKRRSRGGKTKTSKNDDPVARLMDVLAAKTAVKSEETATKPKIEILGDHGTTKSSKKVRWGKETTENDQSGKPKIEILAPTAMKAKDQDDEGQPKIEILGGDGTKKSSSSKRGRGKETMENDQSGNPNMEILASTTTKAKDQDDDEVQPTSEIPEDGTMTTMKSNKRRSRGGKHKKKAYESDKSKIEVVA